jgi:hypothetical protein
MNNFSINIVDESMHIAVISGGNDDPDRWYNEDCNFRNTEIPDVELTMTEKSDGIAYEYTVKNVENKSISINDSQGNSSGLVKIQEFIESIEDYDDITVKEKTCGRIDANMNIDNKLVGIIITKNIGYKCYKYVLKITM